MNPPVQCGLWIITGQCGFIDCDVCTTLVPDVDSGGGCEYVGAGSMWDISVPSALVCCELKTALEKIKYIYVCVYICVFIFIINIGSLFPH